MVILSVDKIAKSFGGDTLFSDVTFEIKDNDKFGFIGPNGAGKTTLFRILTGQIDPDGGAVVRSKGLRVGYMRQMVAAKGSVTGYEEALSVFEDLIETENALLAAAAAVTNLYAIPRHGAGASRINVGKLIAGSGRNVIADEAFMEMEVRGETTAINEYMSAYAMRVLEAAAAMHDCTVEVKTVGASEAFTCDDAVMDRVYETCEKLGLIVSEKRVQWGGGSEDFSLMLNRVQARGGAGTFLRIRADMKAALHHRDFDISEDILPRGVAIFSGMAAGLMQ